MIIEKLTLLQNKSKSRHMAPVENKYKLINVLLPNSLLSHGRPFFVTYDFILEYDSDCKKHGFSFSEWLSVNNLAMVKTYNDHVKIYKHEMP